MTDSENGLKKEVVKDRRLSHRWTWVECHKGVYCEVACPSVRSDPSRLLWFCRSLMTAGSTRECTMKGNESDQLGCSERARLLHSELTREDAFPSYMRACRG